MAKQGRWTVWAQRLLLVGTAYRLRPSDDEKTSTFSLSFFAYAFKLFLPLEATAALLTLSKPNTESFVSSGSVSSYCRLNHGNNSSSSSSSKAVDMAWIARSTSPEILLLLFFALISMTGAREMSELCNGESGERPGLLFCKFVSNLNPSNLGEAFGDEETNGENIAEIVDEIDVLCDGTASSVAFARTALFLMLYLAVEAFGLNVDEASE